MKSLAGAEKISLIMLGVILFSVGTVCAGPPLPTHNVEGNSGVFITSTAYLANPPEQGKAFGLPSVSSTFAAMQWRIARTINPAITMAGSGMKRNGMQKRHTLCATHWNASDWVTGRTT